MSEPIIRILSEEDGPALSAFLASRLTSSIFLASNMDQVGLVDQGERYQGTYAAAFDGEKIVGVAAHYWNGLLVLQAPVYISQILVKVLQDSNRGLKGLVGLEDQVSRAKKSLDLDEADFQLDEPDGLYSLNLHELVVPEELKSGRLGSRRLRLEDLDTLTAWRVAYSVEISGAVENQQLWDQSRDSMEENLRTGQSWVLISDGQVVANTSFNASIQEIVQVGGVFTPPQFRGRGYGRSVVAASLLDAREQGVGKSVLFTTDSNIPARKAYAALGFARIGDFRLSILREPFLPGT